MIISTLRKQIVLTALFILIGVVGVFGQKLIKTSLFLAGNTVSKNNDEQTQFLDELTELDHPYSFVYLGNYSSHTTNNDKVRFNFYPDKIAKPGTKLLFTHGTHEWGKDKKHTKRVVKALHKHFPNNEVFTTDWGCPGPTEVEINDELTVILFDTYWWLTNMDTRYKKCGIEEDQDVFVWLPDALRRNANKTVVVAGYHPIKSYGRHAGNMPTITSLFGFPYAAYKNLIGDQDDLAHPE